MGITALAPVFAEEDLALDNMEVAEGVALNDEEAEFASYDTFEAEEDIAFSMGQITDVRNAFDLQGKTWEGLAAFTWTVHVPGAESITLHFGAAQLTGTYDKVVLEDPHGERTTFTGSELNHRSATVSGDSLSVTMFLEAGSQSQLELERIAKNDADDLTLQAQTNEGTEEVSMTLRQVTGRAIQQVEYTLKNGQGDVVDSVTTSALSYEKKNLPQGEYTVSAKITDGVNTAFVGDQSVLAQGATARAAFTLRSVNHVPDGLSGETIDAVFQADSPVNGSVHFYVYRLFDNYGNFYAEAVTHSPSHTFQLPKEGVYAIQGNAFDGQSYAIAYTNWFRATDIKPLSIAVQTEPVYSAGKQMTIRPTVLSGGRVTFMTAILFNQHFQHVQRWDFVGSEGQITLPTQPGAYALHVWATDSHSQASTNSNWFTVLRPELKQEVVQTTAIPTVNEPVNFKITTLSGNLVWTRINVRKLDGTIVDTAASIAPTYSWVPTQTGTYVFEVISFDGVEAVTNRIEFQVKNKGLYRALVIGMGYSDDPRNALPGTLQDADSVITAFRSLGTDAPVFATMTALKEPTRTEFEDALQHAFIGATEDDVSVVYYSGHGANNGSLVMVDRDFASRYVSPIQLRQMLDRIPGTKIVLVDACHSGAVIGKNVDGKSAGQQFVSNFTSAFRGTSKSLVGSDYYVITSSHSSQLSFEGDIYDGGQHRKSGVFTHCLLKGIGYNNVTQQEISKEANANHDGYVTMMELFTYTSNKASRMAYQDTQYYFTDPDFVFVKD